MVSDNDIYKFDLNGFVILKQALGSDFIASLDKDLDNIPSIEPGEWHGHIQREKYPENSTAARGTSYQQIYEAGESFRTLVDHPAYIEHVKKFVGNQDDFDSSLAPLYIDECFALKCEKGEHIGLHSGGHLRTKRTQFRHSNGKFHCGQINVFIPLTDIGPGDGATLVLPASHKQNFKLPNEFNTSEEARKSVGAIEVHLKKGDVLLFVDAICHGSVARINEGERKVVIYRYGPAWGNSRYGFLPSKQLLNSLTPEQRCIVQPQKYRLPPHLTGDELMSALKMTAVE